MNRYGTTSYHGVIRRVCEVTCSLCEAFMPLLATRVKAAEREVRREGWKFTKNAGWICQDCAKRGGRSE